MDRNLTPSNPSALFALPPMQGGGRATESLLSYLVRLARAHQIDARRLVRYTVWPVLPLDGAGLAISFYREDARTVNGIGRYAYAFTQALERLTSVQGLEGLTFQAWKGVIPEIGAGFLAKEVRWCPACLAEQRHQRVDSHFPLVWSLDAYRVCTRHHRPLQHLCPWCGKRQQLIPHYPDQARCTHCCGYLAPTSSLQTQETIQEADLRRAHSLESMIATPEGRIMPTQLQLMAILQTAAERWTEGEKKKLSLTLGLGDRAIGGWANKQQKPAFPQLLQIADTLGMTLYQLFTQPLPDQAPSSASPVPAKDKPRPAAQLSKASLESRLRQQLDAPNTAEPVSRILKRIGVTRSYAKYWFPELLAQLAYKHQQSQQQATAERQIEDVERVGRVFRNIVAGGDYPSIRRMSQALRPYRLSLQRGPLREEYNELREQLRNTGQHRS
ncbi:TniQ family protein [Chromobacterium sp. IIBBL 290-4]|uniref:TniQ family protein n=1 Tax=Chromobacterium sp. IIBBL 290-4 TaxID=2953890 RepID=UPI0020B8480B|nr:TniQ family protein [Chromobacterium sp. IIBBL 290-4]UTH75195.1 TniQ family protein [Chromobacterium sp. IIBBL 290-4]